MKVKVLVKFKDLKEGKTRIVGEIFEVNKDRLKDINNTKHGILVKEIMLIQGLYSFWILL